MTQYITTDYVFPVFAGHRKARRSSAPFEIDQLLGTAFSISPKLLLTAGHVARSLNDFETGGVAFIQDGSYMVEHISDIEVFTEIDVSVIQVEEEIPNMKQHCWDFKPLAILEEVQACGYPHGWNPEKYKIQVRGLRGHIVSTCPFSFELSSVHSVYEVSFASPRFISGAPLIRFGGPTNIVGMMVGNRRTETNILTEREKLISENTTIIERYEAVQFGIVVRSIEIGQLVSKFTSSTIQDFLTGNQLVK